MDAGFILVMRNGFGMHLISNSTRPVRGHSGFLEPDMPHPQTRAAVAVGCGSGKRKVPGPCASIQSSSTAHQVHELSVLSTWCGIYCGRYRVWSRSGEAMFYMSTYMHMFWFVVSCEA